MVSGFELGFQLEFSFRSSVVLRHVRIGIGKDLGIVFLLRGLILLVGFLAITVELLAVANVKIAFVGFLELATNDVDS